MSELGSKCEELRVSIFLPFLHLKADIRRASGGGASRWSIEGTHRIDVPRGPVHNGWGPRLEAYEIMAAPNEALRMILPIAGWCDGQAADVVFTGGADPVLPTPFRIGAAGAATLAATGLAATELWQARTGRRQRVTVDLRQATAALRRESEGRVPSPVGPEAVGRQD